MNDIVKGCTADLRELRRGRGPPRKPEAATNERTLVFPGMLLGPPV